MSLALKRVNDDLTSAYVNEHSLWPSLQRTYTPSTTVTIDEAAEIAMKVALPGTIGGSTTPDITVRYEAQRTADAASSTGYWPTGVTRWRTVGISISGLTAGITFATQDIATSTACYDGFGSTIVEVEYDPDDVFQTIYGPGGKSLKAAVREVTVVRVIDPGGGEPFSAYTDYAMEPSP